MLYKLKQFITTVGTIKTSLPWHDGIVAAVDSGSAGKHMSNNVHEQLHQCVL